MNEYKGPLVGGPNDGEILTVSSTVIRVNSTSELWLDGPDHDSTIIELSGYYTWERGGHHFIWQIVEAKTYSKKLEVTV